MDTFLPWLHTTAFPYVRAALGAEGSLLAVRSANQKLHTIGPKNGQTVFSYLPKGTMHAALMCGTPPRPALNAAPYTAHVLLALSQHEWAFFGGLDAHLFGLLGPLFPLPKVNIEVRFRRTDTTIRSALTIEPAARPANKLILPFDTSEQWPKSRASIAAFLRPPAP